MPGCVTDHPALRQFLDELQAQEQQRQARAAVRMAQLRAELAGHQGLEPGDRTEQAAHYNARYQAESAALWGDEAADACTAVQRMLGAAEIASRRIDFDLWEPSQATDAFACHYRDAEMFLNQADSDRDRWAKLDSLRKSWRAAELCALAVVPDHTAPAAPKL